MVFQKQKFLKDIGCTNKNEEQYLLTINVIDQRHCLVRGPGSSVFFIEFKKINKNNRIIF
jgi:hypothetical protein